MDETSVAHATSAAQVIREDMTSGLQGELTEDYPNRGCHGTPPAPPAPSGPAPVPSSGESRPRRPALGLLPQRGKTPGMPRCGMPCPVPPRSSKVLDGVTTQNACQGAAPKPPMRHGTGHAATRRARCLPPLGEEAKRRLPQAWSLAPNLTGAWPEGAGAWPEGAGLWPEGAGAMPHGAPPAR